MSKSEPLDFERWTGRRIRIPWIVLWTLVFFLSSACLFSSIPFGQAPTEAADAEAELLQRLRLQIEALERLEECRAGDAGAAGDRSEPGDPCGAPAGEGHSSGGAGE